MKNDTIAGLGIVAGAAALTAYGIVSPPAPKAPVAPQESCDAVLARLQSTSVVDCAKGEMILGDKKAVVWSCNGGRYPQCDEQLGEMANGLLELHLPVVSLPKP